LIACLCLLAKGFLEVGFCIRHFGTAWFNLVTSKLIKSNKEKLRIFCEKSHLSEAMLLSTKDDLSYPLRMGSHSTLSAQLTWQLSCGTRTNGFIGFI
jgi:hypothetical protein